MKIRKSLMVAGAVATIGVASTAAGVHAATNTTEQKDTLADKIATKFNLNKDDVVKVFEEDRAEHHAEMQAKQEERLNQAVADGKITENQKSKILAKLEELKTQIEQHRDEFKDKTPEERKALMEQHRAELEKWASDNGIPMEYLRVVHHFKGGPGPGHPGGEGGGFRTHVEDGDGPSFEVQAD